MRNRAARAAVRDVFRPELSARERATSARLLADAVAGRHSAAMKIRVNHGMRRHEVTIPGSATVAELKDKLQPLTGVPPELQVLTVLSRHQPEPQIQPRP